ncbi:MAG: hypothetical protein U0V56_05905 [Actinomycetota bacterium]
MDHVAVQEQLDVADQLAEQVVGLEVVDPVRTELRRRVVLVADVAHQDRAVAPRDPAVGARGVQLPEHLPLTVDPDRGGHLAAEPRALFSTAGADPPRLDELAVAVQALVAEGPPVWRVVDLQRRQALVGRAGVGAAQVHGGLLAALDRSDDRVDEPFVEECSNASSCNAGSSLRDRWRADASSREPRGGC